MKPVNKSEFFSVIQNSRDSKTAVSIFFHSSWMDSNGLSLKTQLENTNHNDFYSVDIFEYPELTQEFNVRRLPALVTYYGDSKQYRVFEIPHLIRRSFVSPKHRN